MDILLTNGYSCCIFTSETRNKTNKQLKHQTMETSKFTPDQIARAEKAYKAFLHYRSVSDYNIECIGIQEAKRRVEFANNEISAILNGDKQLEMKWKMFFLNEELRRDRKIAETKAKLSANKEATQSVLDYVKSNGYKLADYYSFLKSNKKFAKEFYSKKFTMESANEFMNM